MCDLSGKSAKYAFWVTLRSLGSMRRDEAKLHIQKVISVFHHLPRFVPKQLCALAHLGIKHFSLVNKWCQLQLKCCLLLILFPFSVNCTIFFIDFIFKRPLENHFLQTFIPSMMLSFSSAVSVFITPDIVPGRMGLCVTSLLSLITLFNGQR